MQAYFTKKDALQHLNKLNNKNIQLFGEDINPNGSKKFYVTSAELIFERIINIREPHYYEYFLPNNPVVFGVDLDILKTDIKTYLEAVDIVKDIINKICISAKEKYNFEYNINDFIVLENNPEYQKIDPKKFSFHIIARGLEFEDGSTAKIFFKYIDNKHNIKYADPSIYTNCLRLCYCSKMGKKAYLIPKEIEINNEKTFYKNSGSDKDLYNFWIKTMVTNVSDSRQKIAAKKEKDKTLDKDVVKNTKSNGFIKINSELTDKNIIDILNRLPEEYNDEYDKWIKIGMILHTYNKFNIWDDWSKKSRKYNKEDILKKWEYLNKYEGNKLTYGTLIRIAQECGIVDKKKTIKDIVDEYPEIPVEIKHLKNTIVLDQLKLTSEIFENTENMKIVAVQSEKGTGKTSNLIEYLSNNNMINENNSILILSARRTLGIKFLGDLEKFGFKLYSELLDNDITEKKIICQVDSMMRLKLARYDIIIIDECESMSRYLTSSHFKKNTKMGLIVDRLECHIKSTKKLYILDADLSDRCINYYKNIKNIPEDDIILIINKFKPYTDYTIVSMEYSQWIMRILDYIDAKKKIVIPMASNNKAKDLQMKILEEYPDTKILIIHKETTDEEKMECVKNVNEKWSEYDVVIYTPSVNMGISYDIPNSFDAIFGYGCFNSVAGQEFTQMLHRVRSPKEKNIYVSMDSYRPYNDEDILSYKQVEEIICTDHYLTKYDLHTNLMLPKSNYDENKHAIVYNYPYKSEPIYDLIVRNCKEVLENNQNFCTNFYGYIKHKGYKLKFDEGDYDNESSKEIMEDMKILRNKRVDNELEMNVKGIIEAKDLSDDEYQQKVCQREDYLTDEDRYSIHKYNIKKCYNITNDDNFKPEFVEEFNVKQKMSWFSNISTIKDTELQNTYEKLEILRNNRLKNTLIENSYLDYMYKNTYTYHMYGIGILDKFGLSLNDMNKTIMEDDYKKAIGECIQWLDIYRNDICEKYKLRITNKSLLELLPPGQIKFINQVLEAMYGVKIMKISKKTSDLSYGLTDKDVWKNLPNLDENSKPKFKNVNLTLKYVEL